MFALCLSRAPDFMTEDFYFVRPKTGQRLLLGQRTVPSTQESIFTTPPRLGLVISTYGSPAHVALALAVRRKLYPTLPVLVHDDASPEGDAVQQVCQEFDAEFQTNSARLGHEMGDLSGIVGGLRWAQERGIELLVRMTRRFVPFTDWTVGLTKLAVAAQAGTYGQVCHKYRFNIRSECVALYTGHWALPEIAGPMTQYMLNSRERFFVERYLYTLVGKVYEMSCRKALDWERAHGTIEPRLMYAPWDFLETSRVTPSTQYLWHEMATPASYAQFARKFGLNYPESAFTV